MNPLVLSAVGLAIGFVAVWAISRRVDNYSFVDVAWSLSFAPVALLYAAMGTGWEPRSWCIAALVALWSLRLGTHLWTRVAKHHPQEDARYSVLRKDWKANLAATMLGFFLLQGALVWLLMLPVYLICRNGNAGFATVELAGLALWFVALIGEAVADAQLRRFKAGNPPKTSVCRVGLWRYSRHPNYFFQSLLWWGLFLAALPAPWGWTAILAPLAMLFFLLRVTGIPLTEKLAVESKGEAYRQYQATTSAFVPFPPKTIP